MEEEKRPNRRPRAADNDRFLSWLDGVADPRERYRHATEELEKHQLAVVRLSSIRASAAADAYGDGVSVRKLAEALGVSPSRIHQLLKEAGKEQSARTGGSIESGLPGPDDQ